MLGQRVPELFMVSGALKRVIFKFTLSLLIIWTARSKVLYSWSSYQGFLKNIAYVGSLGNFHLSCICVFAYLSLYLYLYREHCL